MNQILKGLLKLFLYKRIVETITAVSPEHLVLLRILNQHGFK